MRRSDFPIFANRKLVYLDSAASTQKPRRVLEAMSSFYENHYANVHRGVYPLSEEATLKYEEARMRVAAFMGASAEEIVFVRNATEAVNIVARSLSEGFLGPGDTVLVTLMEHHSNFVPWQQLARMNRFGLRVLPVSREGEIDTNLLERELDKGVRLVAITHLSNVLGNMVALEDIVPVVHAYGARILVDGAQAAGRIPVDVGRLDVDYYALSGHKVYGPGGVGVLYAKRELLEEMPPVLYGGEMIAEVHLTETTFNDPPHKFEAGTPALAEALGLAEAVSFVAETGFEEIAAHERKLLRKTYSFLDALPYVEIYGPGSDARLGAISFNVDGVHPHDVAGFLGSEDICIRAGHHCAQPLHEFLGIHSSARVSFGVYNTEEDVDAFCAAIERMRKVFTRAA